MDEATPHPIILIAQPQCFSSSFYQFFWSCRQRNNGISLIECDVKEAELYRTSTSFFPLLCILPHPEEVEERDEGEIIYQHIFGCRR